MKIKETEWTKIEKENFLGRKKNGEIIPNKSVSATVSVSSFSNGVML